MSSKMMLNLAKKKVGTLFLCGLFLAALSFLFLVVTQKNFKSGTDLLVVQNQNGFTDYYALSKSADFLTGVLTESIYSEKFLDEVNNTGVATDSFLPTNKADRLNEWEKIVKITRDQNLGKIHIEVFGNSQKQVMDISNAIVTVLTTKNFLFLGKGQDLDVRILNSPMAEKNPSGMEIIAVILGGFMVGLLLAFAVVYYKAQKHSVVEVDDLIKKYHDLKNAKIISMNEEHIESLEGLQ